ncbi:TIGR02117 family protein [Sphingomonas sp. ID1715]|uniref:TIGR02117 family protein n=1 Tax=Sphingomonas sp. ID1715 TaxID=1656898 RepID=UPI001489D546|nr:TIGR02117 family protein [Sphingomonas sp. ID1715]NNM76623.1 TIGR02117 family protein [Sphingomonas sp. ID1715]
MALHIAKAAKAGIHVLVLLPLLYLAAGAIGGAVPRNMEWREADRGVTIWIATNGVHTGLIVPTRTAQHDWAKLVRPEHIADRRYAGRYLWFGWGDREFYLNTPRWTDVSPRTVLSAAIGSDRTLVHVDHLIEPWSDARPIRLSPEQYRSLVARIRASFDPGDTRPVAGYDVADVFYPARGHYDAIRTCNWWTSEMLAAAGVRVGAWTPFSATLMQWF